MAYDEEKNQRVGEEWRKGRERVRERLNEGIEERRRRAREERDGEGMLGDHLILFSLFPHVPIDDFSSINQNASLDAHFRTRKLRNKLGTTPPPTPPILLIRQRSRGMHVSCFPITSGPFLNPHSLSVDELPSVSFPAEINKYTQREWLYRCVGGEYWIGCISSLMVLERVRQFFMPQMFKESEGHGCLACKVECGLMLNHLRALFHTSTIKWPWKPSQKE